jgi:4-amino-4-deoxy-L-arabinose transferase-like glycosyltransferase
MEAPQSASMNKRNLLLIAIGVTVLIRCAALVAAIVIEYPDKPPFRTADFPEYLNPAISLVSNGTFFVDGEPEIFRTPGYPIFLTPGILLGQIDYVTIALQILCACLIAFLIFKISVILGGSEKLGLVAGLIYAMDPLSVVYCSLTYNETLFAALILLFLYCFLRSLQEKSLSLLVAASVCLAASVYVRPASYYLIWLMALALLVWEWTQGESVTRIVLRLCLFLFLFAMLVVPWQARNKLVAGYWGMSPVGDWMLYCTMGREVAAIGKGEIGDSEDYRWHKGEYCDKFRQSAETYRHMRKEGTRLILDNPMMSLRYMAGGMVRFLFAPGGSDILRFYGIRVSEDLIKTKTGKSFLEKRLIYYKEAPDLFWLDTILGLWLLLILLGSCIAAASETLSRRILRIIPLSIFGYFFIISLAPMHSQRYRLPVMPILFIFAALGWGLVVDKWKRRSDT